MVNVSSIYLYESPALRWQRAKVAYNYFPEKKEFFGRLIIQGSGKTAETPPFEYSFVQVCDKWMEKQRERTCLSCE